MSMIPVHCSAGTMHRTTAAACCHNCVCTAVLSASQSQSNTFHAHECYSCRHSHHCMTAVWHDGNAHMIHKHRSTLYTVVTKYTSADQVGPPLEDGCYVSGLYLEGAGWDHDKQALRRQDPKVNTAAATADYYSHLMRACVYTSCSAISCSVVVLVASCKSKAWCALRRYQGLNDVLLLTSCCSS
jgi:Dynein heavy chain C-terminal domain